MAVKKALTLLRARLCNPTFVHGAFKSSKDSNYSKLKFLMSSSISEACNSAVLLLGPRGSGKIAVVELVIEDLKVEYPDSISVIRLNGLLHSDDTCALKEIARQLCLEYQMLFSKMASSDDNSQFMIDMLRECGLSHKSIVFLLDEFDLFAQGKQRLLYSILDAMQTLSSQAVVIGVSCRLDADQLLEKRVRSRFSHRKLLFVPPSLEDTNRLLEYLLYLPNDAGLPTKYVSEFNSSLQRQPKADNLQDVSILELYILVCMNRLEAKEQNSYNFNSIMKEYKAIQDAYKTSDNYAHAVCLRAFEHLLERELISFTDRGRSQSIEFRPVRLLISSRELQQGLKANSSCPAILQKLFDHESFK